MSCEVKCAKCPFGGAKVSTKGDSEAPLIIVGESPGVVEIREGEPFAGPSGKILHNQILFDPHEMFVTNAMFCNPPKKLKQDPTRFNKAIDACHGRLINSIESRTTKPLVILALGNAATWSLTGNSSLRITQCRGRLIESHLATHGILPALHPAALMRGTGNFRQFKEDLAYAYHLSKGGEPKTYTPCEWKSVDSQADVYYALQQLKRHITNGEITADIETTGFNPTTKRILSIGLTVGRTSYCFPARYLLRLQSMLEDPNLKWAWHNGKFDVSFLRHQNIQATVNDDTMLLSYVLDENPGCHDLETVSHDVLDAPDWKDVLIQYTGVGKNKKDYSVIPRKVLDKYLAQDTSNTHKIRNIYRDRVRASSTKEKLYTTLLLPASELLTHVEKRGFYVDQERVATNSEYYMQEIDTSRTQIKELCGYDLNPNSPKQLQELMFHKWKLPNKRKGSTDAKTLELLLQRPWLYKDSKLQEQHAPRVCAFIKELQNHRKLAKHHGTYVKSVAKHMWADGRIHSTYKLHGTPTGRLTSSDPNLQNQPRFPRLRGQFIAAPGYKLLEIDLSQAELRSLAQLSRDPELVRIYNDNTTSLHKEVAREMYGPDYTKDQYVRAKAVNFGIVYGRTAHTLAEEFQIPVSEGQRMIDSWFRRFPIAKKFITKCRGVPMRGQTMTTVFGRQRHYGIVCRDNLTALQNQASNFPHQSIASDITLSAAIVIRPQLIEYDAYIVNLVHDSIIIEVPDNTNTIQTVAALGVYEMEAVAPRMGLTRVPFIAEPEEGDRWGYLKEYVITPHDTPLLNTN